MGLFDKLKAKKQNNAETNTVNQQAFSINPAKQNSGYKEGDFADSSSVAPDERAYYQPDSYYTFVTNPDSVLSHTVVTFEERKKSSFPSPRGLYVAEIMLLAYCDKGTYPKPKQGYPGFWWFEYGIRDVGHALESLEQRGFIQWASKSGSLKGLKADELKQILSSTGLSTNGKKEELIARIQSEIPEERINIPGYVPKYELTELGRMELEENGYVPYMHGNKHKTTEDARFGETFNVWDINRRFNGGSAANWRSVVGGIEKRMFGVDSAQAYPSAGQPKTKGQDDVLAQRDEIRTYLAGKRDEISKGIATKGDGFDEESKGLDLKAIGKDKEALVMFYISIGKGFNAPALYRECAILLRKYKMYEEELSVIDAGIRVVPGGAEDLMKRREKVIKLMEKEK